MKLIAPGQDWIFLHRNGVIARSNVDIARAAVPGLAGCTGMICASIGGDTDVVWGARAAAADGEHVAVMIPPLDPAPPEEVAGSKE